MYYDKLQEQFVVISPLADDEFIYENGEFYKPDDYFKSKSYEKTSWYDHITKGQKVNPSKENMIIVTWSRPKKEFGPMKYQVVEMLPASRQASNVAFTIGTLFELTNTQESDKKTKATNVNKNDIEFAIAKSLGTSTPLLNIKFGVSSLTKKTTIYLKPYGGSKYEDLFKRIEENKVQDIISFELDEARINKLFDNIINSKVVSNFQASRPDLVHQGKIETREQLDSIVKIAEKT